MTKSHVLVIFWLGLGNPCHIATKSPFCMVVVLVWKSWDSVRKQTHLVGTKSQFLPIFFKACRFMMLMNHCRYLPVTRQEGFDLRAHIETAGHQVTWNEIWPRLNLIQMCNSPIPQIELCKHIVINSCSCRGYLSKQGTRLKGWNRWWWWWWWR